MLKNYYITITLLICEKWEYVTQKKTFKTKEIKIQAINNLPH